MLYNVVSRKKIGAPNVTLWFARAVAAGESTLDQIAEKIETRCTVTRPDILAVLAAFVDDVKDRLQNGLIVRMGELGHLQLGLRCRSVLQKEDFSAELIRGAHVNFRPGMKLKRIARDATFKRTYKVTEEKKEEKE